MAPSICVFAVLASLPYAMTLRLANERSGYQIAESTVA